MAKWKKKKARIQFNGAILAKCEERGFTRDAVPSEEIITEVIAELGWTDEKARAVRLDLEERARTFGT